MSYHQLRLGALVFTVAFVLNAAWEVPQGVLYGGERQSLLITFRHCLPAILLDALFTAALYALLLRSRRQSFPQLTRLGFLLLGLFGVITAAGVELVALAFGWWSYGASMPRVPGLGVGLLPVVQLGVLTPLTFLLLRAVLKPAPR